MRNRLPLVIAACLMIVGLSACDAQSDAPSQEAGPDSRQVTVVGQGQVLGTPDTLTANVSMDFTAPDVTSALNQSSQRQQAVIDALGDSGIDAKDIATSSVSLQPDFGPDGARIVGYRASNSIDVKIRDIKKASATLALIVTTGGDATRINSVEYSIDDDSQLVRDARTRAFDDAKDRAQQYAQLSGLKLGSVISISESAGVTPPTPTPFQAPRGDAAVAAPVPLQPGQQTIGFSVTVVWQLT